MYYIPWRFRHLDWSKIKYRYDPIPGTGKHKGGYRWWRHPKTTQEKRAYYKLEVEETDTGYPIHYRARRSPPNLPQAWWDILHSDWHDHCWKNFRKTQYK